MTQTEYDDIVIGIAAHEIRMAEVTAQMRITSDPDYRRRQEEIIMLQNVLYALKHYDIESEILTDVEIRDMYELATLIVQNCPL